MPDPPRETPPPAPPLVIVCYTRCWPCNFAEHQDPPKAHTWMDQDDAEHAGHPWPLPDEIAANNVCACPCAKEPADA